MLQDKIWELRGILEKASKNSLQKDLPNLVNYSKEDIFNYLAQEADPHDYDHCCRDALGEIIEWLRAKGFNDQQEQFYIIKNLCVKMYIESFTPSLEEQKRLNQELQLLYRSLPAPSTFSSFLTQGGKWFLANVSPISDATVDFMMTTVNTRYLIYVLYAGTIIQYPGLVRAFTSISDSLLGEGIFAPTSIEALMVPGICELTLGVFNSVCGVAERFFHHRETRESQRAAYLGFPSVR